MDIEPKTYYIYILECANGAYYTGYTTDLARRFREHGNGKNTAKFTRSNKPVKIAQCWRLLGPRGQALKVEAYIKRQNRGQKAAYILNPGALIDQITETLGIELARDDDEAQTASEKS